MPAFLSPGVYVREIDFPALPAASSQVLPVFVGTAKKGPLNTPTFCTGATQYVNNFGDPFPESYLGYAVLTYFEEGGACYIVRVGVEMAEGLDAALEAVAIDTSGSKIQGWGRIPLFSGIDYGRINLRAVDADNPITFHAASVGTPVYTDADVSSTHGATDATMVVSGTYVGTTEETYTLVITGDPTVSAAEAIGGATFEVIRASDGEVVVAGIFSEVGGGGTSNTVTLENGLSFYVTVADGVLATNDTFVFSVVPDNRKFTVAVEGTSGSEYTMPSTTYTSLSTLVDAINGLLSGEDYLAVSYTTDDGTVIPQFRTENAGHWIQLVGSKAFAISFGTQQWVYDIPRANLFGSNDGPYNITTQNNRLVINVIGDATEQVSFTIATGLGLSATSLATSIDPNGVVVGDTLFDAIAITVPGGDSKLVIMVSTAHMTDHIQILANFTHAKTLKFADEVGILAPYQRSYRGFWDNRVSLPAGSEGDSSVPDSCATDSDSDECITDSAYYDRIVGWLVATSPGTWINDYLISVSLATEGATDAAGRYRISIANLNGVVIEVIDDVSFDKNATRYIGNVINPGTPFGGNLGNAYVNWEPRPTYLNFDPTDDTTYEIRLPSTFSGRDMSGGANGIPTDAAYSSDLDAAVIGNAAFGTGIFSVQNANVFPNNVLVTPGFSSGAVIGQCLQACESRGDVVYVVDPPFGLKPQEIVDWHNGMLTSDLANAIDSSYGTLYWGWQKYFDQFSRQNIWIPPSGYACAVYARSARAGNFWTPPAGPNRGRLLTSQETEYTPSDGEQGLLQGYGNAVNPIVNFPLYGICVDGQRTLLRTPGPMDRLGPRFTMNAIKRDVKRILNAFLFELNNSTLWSNVRNVLGPYLANIQSQGGLTGYGLIVDESNNTLDRQARNELWVTVLLKFTTAAEFIVVNIGALRNDASFSSVEVLQAGGIVGLS